MDDRKGRQIKNQENPIRARSEKRASCSPQMKKGMKNRVGQKPGQIGARKGSPEKQDGKNGSKLDVSMSSSQSKSKEYMKKRPVTSRPN